MSHPSSINLNTRVDYDDDEEPPHHHVIPLAAALDAAHEAAPLGVPRAAAHDEGHLEAPDQGQLLPRPTLPCP